MPKINDADDFRRGVAGLGLILFPITTLLAVVIDPGTANDAEARILSFAEAPGYAAATFFLRFPAAPLFVPTLFGLLKLLRTRCRPRTRRRRAGSHRIHRHRRVERLHHGSPVDVR
ncbi:MAG: hypothetical protein ACRDSJ_21380 [Rubrobacteraceae bacterium]